MATRLLLLLILITTQFQGTAQMRDQLDTALIPFWKTAIMHNESVLMSAGNDGTPQARLLFKPGKILAVKNSALNITYREGIDWEYAEGRLRLLKGSTAAFLTDSLLYPDSSSSKRMRRKGGGFILFSEGSFFHAHQLAVTYTHHTGLWKGPVPSYQRRVFKELLRKLKSGSKLRFLLFGDSIAAGYNASKESNAPPYLPSWGELVAEKLRRFYGAEIEFMNTAVAGTGSRWGVQTVQDRVIQHEPDLVIIAFGMNDGTAGMQPDTFKANIQTIINRVKAHNPKTAFILVAPMLPNPESEFARTQSSFKPALAALTGDGIALADMTGVHAELLKHKSYQDMTGNHINHPNDFLIRWYAQQILGLLIPPSGF